MSTALDDDPMEPRTEESGVAPHTHRALEAPDARLMALIAPFAAEMGYRIVRVRFTQAAVLEVIAERADGTMPLDDCVALSRALSPLLDAADIIDGTYRLEVSSPGIARPLCEKADFERFADKEARIEMWAPQDNGQRVFKGRLGGVSGDDVILRSGEDSVSLPFADIRAAKLIVDVRQSLRRKGVS